MIQENWNLDLILTLAVEIGIIIGIIIDRLYLKK
jgi:hypothetical protein